jgi:molybdenum cofactor cytidylyltransferase
VITLVLAAGRGTRIGGPKALLAWTLLPQRWLLPLAAAHVEARTESDRVIVVVRRDVAVLLAKHAAVSFAKPGRGELCVSEAADALGPAGSIAAAMTTCAIADDAIVLVTPVDCPPASSSTVAALLAALSADPSVAAAKPRHRGRDRSEPSSSGHPVALRARLLASYRGETEPVPLRDVLGAVEARVVDVDDPAVATDIDDADTLADWARRHGGSEEPLFFD